MGRTGWSLAVAAVTLMALVGCDNDTSTGAPAPPPPPVIAARAPVADKAGTEGIVVTGAQRGEPEQGKYLAVTQSYSLSLPASAVELVQNRHLETCAKLGCLVLDSSLDHGYANRITARTSIRIPPQGVAALVADLTAPPARVTSHSITTEDMTTTVLDTDKRLESKTALRDRLTALMHGPTHMTVSDLVAAERELANTQGEIESLTAQRDYLRRQTEMVRIDVDYNGEVAVAGDTDLTPISSAFKGFGRTMVRATASLIATIAGLLPWLPLILLAGWVLRHPLKRLLRR
ncbi:DUF4349 domain-containing protein [Nitrospirillum sp. BR 11163]|uniref:DUF4349 domain-containing protein n=1 Tax=Nitrospirillum sp. BR 11163 TaxID=3104323 RepID=UPI002B001741|nr:DUF4349 domain-containing protein [Nitrospirillum sp. BR 11163]MEA1674169.1 DUF4349 domain-containing protein [Nitrospirillum sp. BR 11163]